MDRGGLGCLCVPWSVVMSNARQLHTTLRQWLVGRRAEVRIASYSLGREMLNTLGCLRAEGCITYLACHLSREATQKVRDGVVVLSRLCDELHLCHIHAKILLVRYEDGRVRVLITSQNATRSSSYECFVTCEDVDVWAYLTAELERVPSYKPML